MTGRFRTIFWHGGAAVLLTALAVFFRWLLHPWLGEQMPLVTVYGAVAVAVWLGGCFPAILVVLLSYLACGLLFHAPRGAFPLSTSHDVAALLAYLFSCSLIVGFGTALRTAERQAEGMRERREPEGAQPAADDHRHAFHILESITDAYCTLDRAWRYTYLNTHAERYFGRPRQELLGKVFWEVFPQTKGSLVEEQYRKAVTEGVPVHFEVRSPITHRWIEVHAYPSAEGLSVVFRDISEWKEAEAKLRGERERVQQVADAVPALISYIDAEARYRLNNRAYETWFGHSRGEMVGKHLREVLGESAWDTLRPYVEATLAGRVVHYEAEVPYRDGGTRWISATYTPDVSPEGVVRGFVAHVNDVTLRRRMEEALRESEERFRGIFDQTIAGIAQTDLTGRFVQVNARYCEIVGRSAVELSSLCLQDITHPDDLLRNLELFERMARGNGAPFVIEKRHLRPDGTVVWVSNSVSLLRDRDGKPRYAVAVSLDISDRKRTEEALRESELRYRLVGQAANDAIWDWNLLTDQVTWNEGIRTLFGYPDGQVGSDSTWWSEHIHAEDRQRVVHSVHSAIASGEGPWHDEYRFRRADGSYAEVFDRGQVVHNEAGQPVRMVGSMIDLTERKATEQALRESEERFRGLMEQAPFSVQVFAADGSTLRVNRAWEALWGITLEQINDYNVLHDPQLEAKGILPYIRRAFAGEPVDIPAIQYDPNETLPDRTRHPDPRRWVAAVAYPLKDEAEHVREVVLVHEDRTARMRAEDALRDSEATLRAFYDNSPVCMGVTEPTGDGDVLHLYDNPATCHFFGIEPGATTNRRALADLGVDPALVARWLACYQASAESGQPVHFEHEFRTPAGVRWLSATICPVGSGPSGRTRFCYVAEDVTERRHQQEQLRQSEERLRLALEAGRMGVWDWDIRTNTIQWSDNLEPIHGLPPGSFGGTLEAFQQLIHPDDREPVHRAIARSLADRSSYDIEFRNVWPDGSVHWMAGKGQVFTEGDIPVRMVGVGMDITQRKRAERDARFLADASVTLAGLVDYESTLQKVARLAVPDFADWCSVDMLDEGGGLRRLAVAHVDPSKVELAHELHRRYPPDPSAAHGVWNILRTGQAEILSEITDAVLVASVKNEGLLRIMRELGLRSYMGVPLSVRGKVLGVITFIAAESGRRYDQTDLAVAEDLAHRAAVAIENARLYQEVREADRKKEVFLAVLAHELRNPLAPIRNALHILKLAGTNGEVILQARDMAERQLHSLTRMVDDLLDVSRIMRGKIELRRERLELATIVRQAVETVRPAIDAAGHELSTRVEEEPVWLEGDVVRLAQVIANLLHNSAKYTDRGGHIWLTAQREGEQAVVRVRDSGIGIAPDRLRDVFDMFMQVDSAGHRAQGGLGIGLTVVRNLVQMHGGTVVAHSEGLGRGSEFVVRLPLLEGPEAGHGNLRAEPPTTAQPPARKILVTDDNIDAAESLAVLLRLEGHEVRVAHDGPSALRLAEADPPEMAFLDIGMPRMDGLELARRFRAHHTLRTVILVALTGWGQEEDRRRTREAGFDHHMVKPVEPDALHRLLTMLPQGETSS